MSMVDIDFLAVWPEGTSAFQECAMGVCPRFHKIDF